MNAAYLKLGAGALILVGAFGSGYVLGSKSVQADWDKTLQAQTQQDHAVLLVGMKDSFDTGTQHEETKEEIRYITETIVQKIPVYIQDTSTCPRLPPNWGMLHSASTQAANAIVASGKLDDEGAAALLGLEPR